MKISRLFLFLLFIVASSANVKMYGVELNIQSKQKKIASLFQKSDLWPFYVKLKKNSPLAKDQKSLSNAQGVLIRIENDRAIVDFGRDGILNVKIEQTDIVENAGKIASGDLAKEFPNFVRYTSNTFIYRGSNGRIVPRSDDWILRFNSIFLLYVDQSFFDEEDIVNIYSDFRSKLGEQRKAIIIIPRDVNFYFNMPKEFTTEMPLMHSSLTHLKMLQHSFDDKDALVEVDLNGKILTFSERAADEKLSEFIVRISSY